MATRQNEWIARRRAQLVEAYGGACNACGAVDELEFAHIKPTALNGLGRGNHARLRDVLRNPVAYLLLCVECHEQLDGATYRSRNGKRVAKVKGNSI